MGADRGWSGLQTGPLQAESSADRSWLASDQGNRILLPFHLKTAASCLPQLQRMIRWTQHV